LAATLVLRLQTSKQANIHLTQILISAEIGAEYLGVGLALAYERGFVKVCDSNLKLKNSGLFLKLSCRLFDVRDVLNINK